MAEKAKRELVYGGVFFILSVVLYVMGHVLIGDLPMTIAIVQITTSLARQGRIATANFLCMASIFFVVTYTVIQAEPYITTHWLT